MGLRERVRQAIVGPVTESEKLLAELDEPDAGTSLPLLVGGWFRGLAAALEELAIAVEDLQTRTVVGPPQPESRRQAPEAAAPATAEGDRPARADRAEDPGGGEEQLLDQARRSREETAELREQTKEARRELEGERE